MSYQKVPEIGLPGHP